MHTYMYVFVKYKSRKRIVREEERGRQGNGMYGV